MNLRLAVVVLAVLATGGCDRRVEPFVPGEQPKTPDLTKIFPEGAERAAETVAQMPPSRGAAPVGSSAASIEGTIEVPAELAAAVPPNAVVFLMARSSDGALVAAKRINSSRFPLAFSIGSQDSMSAPASFVGPLSISVRIDADGNATTRDVGDLLGAAAETHGPGDRGVVVRISEVQQVEFAGDLSASSATGNPHAAAIANPHAGVAGAPAAAAMGAPSSAATGASSEAIEGTIEIAPELAGRVARGATVFVIARTAPTGPPLAVVRVPNPTFPMPFSIGPGDRMIQAMPFAGEIRLSVRVDADGNVMSRDPGDLAGESRTPHAPGDRGVKLVVDQAL